MTTFTIKNEDIKLTRQTFDTFEQFIEEVEDYKLGRLMSQNTSRDSYDISILEKKYLGK